jgi:hypothetical protein
MYPKVNHTLIIENVMVQVLDKSIFQNLEMDDRIVEHGKNLPREQFLSILCSMDLNLYMSFNESWGLVAKESETMGVPHISHAGDNYYQLIYDKIESRK